jgi:hypothetical protein
MRSAISPIEDCFPRAPCGLGELQTLFGVLRPLDSTKVNPLWLLSKGINDIRSFLNLNARTHRITN